MSTICQKLRRFKFTLRDDKKYNHTVYANIIYIDAKPILHFMDETTFQSALWLPDMTSKTLRKASWMCCIGLYPRPPDFIVHDLSKTFMGAVFQASTDVLHIRTNLVFVK